MVYNKILLKCSTISKFLAVIVDYNVLAMRFDEILISTRLPPHHFRAEVNGPFESSRAPQTRNYLLRRGPTLPLATLPLTRYVSLHIQRLLSIKRWYNIMLLACMLAYIHGRRITFTHTQTHTPLSNAACGYGIGGDGRSGVVYCHNQHRWHQQFSSLYLARNFSSPRCHTQPLQSTVRTVVWVCECILLRPHTCVTSYMYINATWSAYNR